MDNIKTNTYSAGLRKYLLGLKGFLRQRKFITFLFFLVLSAAFWFIRALGEQYESNVNYPVRYINFPENKVLVGNVPDKLHLTVRASGFNLLRRKLHLDFAPLRFNVNAFSLSSKGADTFFIVTETVKDVLSAELKDMTILSISPDTLFFKLSGISVKKVPVVPSLSLHSRFFQQQFMLNGKIEVLPDSITISGPAALVDSIQQVYTVPVNYTGLSDTVKDEFNIKPMDMITFSQQKVKTIIPVDRFTEVENRQTVMPVNVPDSLNLIPIPGQVSITYRICISNYHRMRNNPLTPRIDYNDIEKSDIPRLHVFLTDTPDYISNLQFNPRAIEFLITRK